MREIILTKRSDCTNGRTICCVSPVIPLQSSPVPPILLSGCRCIVRVEIVPGRNWCYSDSEPKGKGRGKQEEFIFRWLGTVCLCPLSPLCLPSVFVLHCLSFFSKVFFFFPFHFCVCPFSHSVFFSLFLFPYLEMYISKEIYVLPLAVPWIHNMGRSSSRQGGISLQWDESSAPFRCASPYSDKSTLTREQALLCPPAWSCRDFMSKHP